jgi:TFIIF-interacting CTD phosphatase-like protein
MLVAVQYHNGKHVRDLSKLNRDLSQVLFISGEWQMKIVTKG